MKVAGIIMECNPLHEGHRYLLETARRETAADAVVVVMSGNFVQRGEPAVQSKYFRALSLLEAGADLVAELPVTVSTGAAPDFAQGAVTLLAALGVVDTLVFGSESGDLDSLQRAAEVLQNEDEAFRQTLLRALADGASYPRARAAALGVSQSPNDLLGTEYLRALLLQNSSMRPHAVRRIEAVSAAEIRQRWRKAPPTKAPTLLFPDAFSEALRLRLHEEERYEEIWGISEALANRMRERLPQYHDWEQFLALLKTREVTHTHVSRALTHLLLDLRKDEVASFAAAGRVGYIRILGLNRGCPALFSELKKKARLPLLSRLGDLSGIPAPFDRQLQLDLRSAEFYESLAAVPFLRESQRKLLVVDRNRA